MEGKNWSKFEGYKRIIENRYNKFFIRWQKTFAKNKQKT